MKLHEFSLPLHPGSDSTIELFPETLKLVQAAAEKGKWKERYCLVHIKTEDRVAYYEVHTVDYIKGRLY